MELTSSPSSNTTTTITVKKSTNNKNTATATTTTTVTSTTTATSAPPAKPATPVTPSKAMSDSTNGNDSRKKPQLFHSVSIIVEPVLDDDSSSIPLVLTPNEVTSESTIMPSVSPTSPVCDYDDFIFESESQRKKSQEEDEIVQALMANAQLRKEEFARLLDEHAQLVNEINRAETTLL